MQSLTVQGEDLILTESRQLDYLRIRPGVTVRAAEGKTVTMVIDGHPARIQPGEYEGDIRLVVRQAVTRPFEFGGGQEFTYRPALYIRDNTLMPAQSVEEAAQVDSITEHGIDGVRISGTDYDFNGIIVDGDSTYEIANAKIGFRGNGTNDFMGMGFGIMAVGNSKLLIRDCDIHTRGVVRGTVYAGGNSEVTIRHSTLFAETTDELPIGYKQHIGLGDAFSNAWVLGTLGSCRATFFTDCTTVNIEDCVCKSQGWGVLSVDMPKNVRMNVKNTVIEKTGESAYGAFTIGACMDIFDNCDFRDITFALIMSSNQGSAVFKNHTRVNARIGVIAYRNYEGTLEILDKCVFRTEKAGLCFKGCSSRIHVKDSEFYPANGVLFQLMDNDEQPNADGYYMDPLGEEDVPMEGRDITEADPTEDVFVTFEDMTINDDIFNGSTNLYVNQRCPQFEMPWTPPPGPKHHGFGADLQGAKNLDVELKNVRCSGRISASEARHESPLLTQANYYEIGVVTNKVKPPVNNGVIVHMDGRSVWTVPGECYLTGLHLAEGAVLRAGEGRTLHMTVDGAETAPAPGSYRGMIHLTVE